MILELRFHLRGKSSDQFKDLYKMELLTSFDAKLTSLLGEVLTCHKSPFRTLQSFAYVKNQYVQ